MDILYIGNYIEGNVYSGDSSTETDATIDFASETDSTLYTVETTEPVLTLNQQNFVYLLEIRNLLLIFLLSWVLFKVHGLLKNLFYTYF